MNPRAIRTAIIVDFIGTARFEPEEEIEQHKKLFGEAVAPDTLVVTTPIAATEIEAGTELVIFDFGGLMPGCEGLASAQSRAILKWAEEHPSGLVVVVSAFTFTGYVEPELEDSGLTLPNVILYDGRQDQPIPEWWLGHKPAPLPEVHGNLIRPGSPTF